MAALSHPNILAIFDFGTDDGVTYAVTELLEGRDAARGSWTGRPCPEARPSTRCLQIAEGLAAATARASCTATSSPTTSS